MDRGSIFFKERTERYSRYSIIWIPQAHRSFLSSYRNSLSKLCGRPCRIVCFPHLGMQTLQKLPNSPDLTSIERTYKPLVASLQGQYWSHWRHCADANWPLVIPRQGTDAVNCVLLQWKSKGYVADMSEEKLIACLRVNASLCSEVRKWRGEKWVQL